MKELKATNVKRDSYLKHNYRDTDSNNPAFCYGVTSELRSLSLSFNLTPTSLPRPLKLRISCALVLRQRGVSIKQSTNQLIATHEFGHISRVAGVT